MLNTDMYSVYTSDMKEGGVLLHGRLVHFAQMLECLTKGMT